MKTRAPQKDESGKTWPEIEAEVRGQFGGVALLYQLLAREAKWMEDQEEIVNLGCPFYRIKRLEKACREMRHSLVGEGWTQEQLQTAFGDVGAAGVTEPPKGGTPTASTERDDTVKKPRVFFTGKMRKIAGLPLRRRLLSPCWNSSGSISMNLSRPRRKRARVRNSRSGCVAGI